MKRISYEDFLYRYQPVKPTGGKKARRFEGIMFDKFGDDKEIVELSDENFVWTLVQGSYGYLSILSGLYEEEAVGFFITTIPHPIRTEVIVDEGYQNISLIDIENLEKLKHYCTHYNIDDDIVESLKKVKIYCEYKVNK